MTNELPDFSTAQAALAAAALANPNPVVGVDGDDRVSFVNPAAGDMLQAWKTATGQQLPARFRLLLAQVRHSRKPTQIVVPAGERSFQIDVVPAAKSDEIYMFAVDVTQHLSTEQQLEVMARFPEENPNPVFRIRRSGEVEYSNEAGADLLQALGAEPQQIVREWQPTVESVSQTERAQDIEVTVDGRTWLLAVTPIAHADYLYVYSRDITDIRAAEDALRQARDAAEVGSRAKSTFLANMSHELRTPLNAIIGYSELLSEEADELTPEQLQGDLSRVLDSARHLLSLINSVLDLSKIEAGKADLCIEEFALGVMLSEVRSTVVPLASKNNNQFEIVFDGTPQTMTADCLKLKQMLINLSGNAAKFTSDGKITLHVSQAGEDVMFVVEDTGIGISEEQLAKLFRPFVQADSSTTKQYGGTGLGLTITNSYCQMMGGSVDVQSQVGQGTRFTLRIPRNVEPPSSLSRG